MLHGVSNNKKYVDEVEVANRILSRGSKVGCCIKVMQSPRLPNDNS